MKKLIAPILFALACFGLAPAYAGDVFVKINVPAPVVVLPAPPPMVWLPGPRIYVAHNSPHEIFFEGGHYYLHDHGRWYRGPGYAGPWIHINIGVLPPPLHRYDKKYWKKYQKEARYRYEHEHDDDDHPAFYGREDAHEKHRHVHAKGHKNKHHKERDDDHDKKEKKRGRDD